MRGVAYQDEAAAAVDAARAMLPRADEVIMALEWTLIRDRNPGLPYGGGHLRYIVFDGAKSGNLPSVDCLFELTDEMVTIHELEFY